MRSMGRWSPASIEPVSGGELICSYLNNQASTYYQAQGKSLNLAATPVTAAVLRLGTQRSFDSCGSLSAFADALAAYTPDLLLWSRISGWF
jgi:hypothetical protein